jgi:hypothetical protein
MKKTEFDQMMKNSFADRVVNIPSKTDNQIIAEFMGLDSFKDSLASLHQGNINVDVDLYKQSQYHSSWDWLMPVVEKCFNKQEEVSDDLSFKLNDALLETNIESLYRVVVEFINQYNK